MIEITQEVSQKEFQLMEIIGKEEISTQRQLASQAGFSLSKVNFVLKKLLEKGLVKIGNFKKNPKKIGYVYLLTPKGIEAKSKITVSFVMAKLEEYNQIKDHIENCLSSMTINNIYKIIFVGPSMIKDIVDAVVDEKKFKIKLISYCDNWQALKNCNLDKADAVLLSDDSYGRLKDIKSQLNNSSLKIILLWE
ncbi:transcriptional regulator, MarR family [Candidatus Magnetomorum sp. HK-1]|nr:transcriptional regulator, MarR family [Candidatus Magnetomorum sp. HK-1]